MGGQASKQVYVSVHLLTYVRPCDVHGAALHAHRLVPRRRSHVGGVRRHTIRSVGGNGFKRPRAGSITPQYTAVHHHLVYRGDDIVSMAFAGRILQRAGSCSAGGAGRRVSSKRSSRHVIGIYLCGYCGRWTAWILADSCACQIDYTTLYDNCLWWRVLNAEKKTT